MKSCLKHVFSEAKTFFPSNQDRTHVLIVLLRTHFLFYLLPQLLLSFLFLHFSVVELFPSLGLSLHILSCLGYFLFSSFQVLNEDFAFGAHCLNSLPLLLNRFNMLPIQIPISFYLQKLIGSVYFDEFLCCFILLVPVRVIFQGKSSIVLLKESEVTVWWSVEYFIWISFKFFDDLFQSLHLIRVIIIIKMAYWINGIKQYIWPTQSNMKESQVQQTSQMSRLARLKRLSQILQSSIYTKTQQQQICMFYSSLIEQYPQSRCSKIHPQFLYEPPIYVPLLNFNIPLKVQTLQIYCELQLVIVFQQEIAMNMPSFYIKNPDYNRYKPKDKYVKYAKNKHQTYHYQSVFGGIKAIVPNSLPERWQWSAQAYYKQQNIVNIVRWIHKTLLLSYFPFVKRKTQISTQIYQKSKLLRDFLDSKLILSERSSDLEEIPLLQNIQSANTLSISIQSQISQLRLEISKMKEVINNSAQFNMKDFYPTPKDSKSEMLLEAKSSLQAYKDVENQIQKQYLKGSISFQHLKESLLLISASKFQNIILLSTFKSSQQ